jgi:hypothetical protein
MLFLSRSLPNLPTYRFKNRQADVVMFRMIKISVAFGHRRAENAERAKEVDSQPQALPLSVGQTTCILVTVGMKMPMPWRLSDV